MRFSEAEERSMPTETIVVVTGVVVAFAIFAAVLGWVNSISGSGR